MINYDIGVAAPPDICLNFAHPHFAGAPDELFHYAVREWHHVGFLGLRALPELSQLSDPDVLGRAVRFFTQLEGMAVHAARPIRARTGQLGGDPDYAVYTDAEAGRRVIDRYREVRDNIRGAPPLDSRLISSILGAMSSGERLWYCFGAIASRHIEDRDGPDALIATIRRPEAFDRAAEALLGRSH